MTTPEDSPEAIACRKCGAEAGQPCHTTSGRKAEEAHLPRRRAYYRRHRDDPIAGDSPLLRAAAEERAARAQLDR